MKPPKAEIQIWIDALRSGKYSQTTGKLQDKNGYCCLGVACEVFVPRYAKGAGGYLKYVLPRVVYGAPEWLEQINSDFIRKTGKALSTLNDIEDFTFDDIADLLQAVYIEEVLA